MPIYNISGHVDTVRMRMLSGIALCGQTTIPPFRVEANDQREAEYIAQQIVDPLNLAPAHRLTVIEEPAVPAAYIVSLSNELDTMIRALNGDSNDQKHAALYGAADIIADLLGFDLETRLADDRDGV
jgi:hypothetical protein